MFKLVVLLALVAITVAKPGYLAPAAYSTAVVGSIPTTISQQSSSIVHSAALVSPVVHTAPIVATAPTVVSTYTAPVISSSYPAPFIGAGYYGGHYWKTDQNLSKYSFLW